MSLFTVIPQGPFESNGRKIVPIIVWLGFDTFRKVQNHISLWVSPAPRRPGSNLHDQQAHTPHVDVVFTTPSTLRAADAFTKSLLVTTPSESSIATRQWRCGSRPLLHDARLCGRDSDKATASPLASQIIAYCSPPPPHFLTSPPQDETCGNCSADGVGAANGR